ncbi:hypothetical protein [Mesobacillus harenae]|uniref:hypothetical protein n=1 Tax=Mesobacillus harenae TaxID=2213203 RepID=UPI0015811805|nr:hypothetical protein [Mesobacillus harenae]
MYDKAFTVKTANQVLKDVIIPNLTDGVAKEQAIALISVLKNLEKNTSENTKPKEQIINLMERTLLDYAGQIKKNPNVFRDAVWADQLEEAIKQTEIIEGVTEKWKNYNDLQCQLLYFLYKESLNNPTIEQKYIAPLRKQIREQLNIEIALVR